MRSASANPISVLFATTRPAFLLLTPACAAVGIGTAYWTTGGVSAVGALLALAGALAAHVSVNMLNEYFDFRSGLDAQTQRTPFSGGSGALPGNPSLAGAVLFTGLLALVLTGAVGLHFLLTQGRALLPLGIAGLVVVLAYTPWVTRHPVASLLAPGLGFGPLMVVGTHVALTGEYSAAAWAASLVPFGLVNGLLLLNQFPDVDADRAVGRRHLPMLLGRPRAVRVYAVLVRFSFVALLAAIVLDVLPGFCALGFVTVPLAYVVIVQAARHADDLPALLPVLGLNVALTLTTPLLLAAGLFLAKRAA